MSIKRIAMLLTMAFLGSLYGYGQSMTNSIQGITFLDLDDDGIRTSNDTILPLVKIDLFDEFGDLKQFTFTDTNGEYSFTNLEDGVYYLRFERKQGLMLALKDAGDDSIDSDLPSNGVSSLFPVNSSTQDIILDAGFRSSILIQAKAFIHACEGEEILIEPTYSGHSGNLIYHWSHDGSTESSVSVIPDSNLLINLTVSDDWNMPIVKKIFIKLTKGVSSKQCDDIDVFDFEGTPIDIFVNDVNPGPITVTDFDEKFIGGGRTITIELLEGANVSSINSSSTGVFINNCSGCKTETTFTYFSPDGVYLDIAQYSYFELTEMKIDQGNVAVSIVVTDDNYEATLMDRIESEGPNSDILPVFFFEDFDNFHLMDFSQLRTISLKFTSINESIDILMSSILSCRDEQCQTTLIGDQNICLTESVTIGPETTCNEDLIFLWDNLGFGQDQTVSPTDSTSYQLTVFDQNGCSESLSTEVHVNQPPLLVLNGPDLACFGDSIEINAIASEGMSPYTIQWDHTSSDSTSVQIIVLTDTIINATVIDSNGCTASAQIEIEVRENPSVSLSVTHTLCSHPTGVISAQINGGTPPYSIEWSNGIMNEDSITKVDYGLYTVEITDSLGCSTMATAFVDYLPCAELGNYVWHDINYNGIQDSTDVPLPDMVVLLKNELEEEIARDTTDENGIYLFRELEGGDYFVEFSPPAEFKATRLMASGDETVDSNADTLTYSTERITLQEYEKNMTIDAGWYKTACIGDQVWNDINLNHYFDSLDVGIENVVVKLMDCNETLLDSTFTDSIGNYQFCDLLPGEYLLQFCNPDGFVAVNPNVGNEEIDSDIDPEFNTSECKLVSSGDTLLVCDAGFYSIASIGDYIWHDLNADGVQDSAEPAFPEIPLSLYTCDDEYISSTLSDSSGYYIFDSLAAGEYYVAQSPSPNTFLSPYQVGQDSLLDNNISALTYQSSCISLDAGTDLVDIDAGLYYEASLGDYVWEDYDLDGLQDPAEKAVQGLALYLYSCDDQLIDSTLSDENGYYLFEGLTPGSYKVTIALEKNQAVTLQNFADAVINNDINPLTLTSECVTLSSAEFYRDLDVGIYNLGKIGDFVWHDDNGNGLQDSLEAGAQNISITLSDCNDNVVSIIQTDATGNYCFSDVPYGDYQVHFDIPQPYYLVNSYQGPNSGLDSDPDPGTNTTACVSLTTPVDSTIDAGIITCSAVGGTVWFDAVLMNGIHDPFENGINGIRVNAYIKTINKWQLIDYAYTGLKPGYYSEDGYWEMCLPPGEYYFEFSNIPVIEAVEPNQGDDDAIDSDAIHYFGINTTDVIEVFPGVPNFTIGMGYHWKTHLLKSDQKINSLNSKIVVDSDQSTIRFIQKSGESHSAFEPENRKATEKSSSETIKIYPNPSTGFLNVQFVKSIEGDPEFMLVDSNGKSVSILNVEKRSDSQPFSIDVSALTPGSYHLIMIVNDSLECKPFIKI